MFEILTTEQLMTRLKGFKFTRQIKQLHIHHTYAPSHKDYNGSNGLQLQQNMADYHIKTRGWQAIGQHLTLLPDGRWVTGRDWNTDPASITGWNAGAFAIEMLGNFDSGHDIFTGKQAEAIYAFSAVFMKQMGLDINSDLKFHRDNPTAGKTCPGTSINKANFITEVKKRMSDEYTDAIGTVCDKLGINKIYWLTKKNIDPYFSALIIKFANYIKKG